MNIDSHLLKLHQPMHTPLAGPLPTSPLERDSLGAAPAWASSAREIDRQCLRVLRCTARALAAGAGGLRFTPGARVCSHSNGRCVGLPAGWMREGWRCQIAPAICKPPDKADAGRQANPEGKMNAGRIAALRLACVAVLHGTHRALHCIPAFIFRTPV